MSDIRNFYTVTFFSQGETLSEMVLCSEAAQAKALISERFSEIDVVGTERTFFPKIETRVYYNKNLGEYYIIPSSWLEGKRLEDEEEICSAALKAGVILKHIKDNGLEFVAR